MRRMNIGTGSRQHHAIDRVQQGADIGDFRGRRKHQRQRARDFGHRPEISFTDHLCGKSVFDAMGIPDHTDHRPPHPWLPIPCRKSGTDHASRSAADQHITPPSFTSRPYKNLKPVHLLRLIPGTFGETVPLEIHLKGAKVAGSADNRLEARGDLAWAISVGGIGVVIFAALLLFAWYFAATLFLIFAGMLLGVALNAMTNMLGRVVRLPHSLGLAIVCLVLAGLLSGAGFLGGATIAQQATVLSDTIKSQLVGVKAFLERNGIDTSYFDLGNPAATPAGSATSATPGTATTPATAPTHNLPSAGALASSGGAIVSQTLKLL